MSKEFSCEYAMSAEVQHMSHVTKGCDHGPAPIPEEGKWIQSKQITDISGYTHGIGWCAPQQGACKLSLNVKNRAGGTQYRPRLRCDQYRYA